MSDRCHGYCPYSFLLDNEMMSELGHYDTGLYCDVYMVECPARLLSGFVPIKQSRGEFLGEEVRSKPD